MKMMKTKHFRRWAVFLAMIAPAVYLFGTSFSALTGAHGEKILEDTSYVTPSYDELMTPENFSYGAFDWTNDNGTRVGFSLGYIQNLGSNDGIASVYVGKTGLVCECTTDTIQNRGLGFAGDNIGEYALGAIYFNFSDLIIETDEYTYEECYLAGYVVDDPEVSAFILTDGYLFWYAHTSTGWQELNPPTLDMNNYEHFIYFDDGAHLPEGVTWNDDLRSYFVPTVKPVETTSYPVTLFGSFFPRDNFLVQWGRNAISEEPYGFAPFGAFWRYLDINVLHLSNDQVGLMGYGYIYYASHVLLFDIGFIIVTFFLDFIQRIFEKFTGGE